MPPVEAWEKVWIDGALYAEDVHAYLNCTSCHGGEAVDDMDAAHATMNDDEESTCETCHPDIAPHAENSLHSSLVGYDTAIYQRSSPEHFAALEEMESYHCQECHATCGDCHVSQPDSVGGGLLEGHTFVEEPPMSRTCTACHGSRVKNEYYGLNEGISGDVHLRQARLSCTDCHTSAEMHGQDEWTDVNHRYDGPAEPDCIDCHEDDVGVASDVLQHQIHGTELLSCQVCHSVSYTNCTNCHVDRTEDDVPYYSVEAHELGFYIGRNTLQSNERPYRYVTVRHVPADPDQFEVYGDDLLNNFLNRPTWVYSTPHNIQLQTPQNSSCTACHGNDDVFLTADKVEPSELGGANLHVVVEQAPPIPANAADFLGDGTTSTQPPADSDTGGDTPSDGDAGFWGADEGTSDDATSDDAGFWGTDEAGTSDDAESNDAGFWGADEAGTSDDAEAGNAESDDAGFWGDATSDEDAASNNTETDIAATDNTEATDDPSFWAQQ